MDPAHMTQEIPYPAKFDLEYGGRISHETLACIYKAAECQIS
jgi:hypothetical protein